MDLLEQYHPLRGRELVTRSHPVEINTAAHLMASIVQSVPGGRVPTRLFELIDQHPHLLPKNVVYFHGGPNG